MKKMNIGLVGAGFMGKAHMVAFSNMPKLFTDAPFIPVFKTVCDIVPEIAEDFKERYGFEKACTDWMDIINDPEIDIVSVCTPNSEHAAVSIAALKAGKHVICEKPIASTTEDAKAMAEAAAEAAKKGIVSMNGYQYRRVPAIDEAKKIIESGRLGELTKRAWEHNVQVMVEGPGHVPLDQVAANMKVQQSICMGAPFYVLGPIVTDIAPGYDHITSAIGGAVAAMSGAAFLCYVTPAEHLALPNVDDVKQGIIASKIAAHAADIAKGVPGARDIDDKMADARRKLDWEAQYACALDPDTARAIRDSRSPEEDHSDTCSMCGKFCAVRSMNKALAGEYIDIL